VKKEAVLHVPVSEYAHALSETRVVIRLRSAKNDLTSCILRYCDRASRIDPPPLTDVPMSVVFSDTLFDWWEVEFETPYKRLCYCFEIVCGKEKILYYSDLFADVIPAERSGYFQISFIHRADIAIVPDWAYDAVFYNIFPDSFATGHRHISLKPTQREWKGEITRARRGGTVKGITENVDYLKELGVNCVYINPMFAAGEYHKYDVIDYFNVDPCFGTNGDFDEMVKTLHNIGIRVVIDGVFNHCGWKFFAFDDVVKNGANSKYADWFYRLEYPVVRPETGEAIPGYECFAYERLMPKLNTVNPEVSEYLCEVGQYWLREYDIDGWRLDCADETNDGFWRAFKNAALAAKSDALLIGEVWNSAMHWLDGTMFHSTMNYDLRKHCRAFFAEGTIDAEEFNARVVNMLTRYRKQLTCVQLNLLDSHDVSRFLTVCGGDKRRLKLAVMFQMCFAGMPSIFYGDEQGFDGLTEDEYRRPMDWDGDRDIFEFYRWSVKLRNNNAALRRGDFKIITAQNSLFAFSREYKGEKVTVALNAGDTTVLFDGREIEPFGYYYDI
jgi:glycosidase